MKKNTDNVRMGDDCFHCEHCGNTLKIQMPISIQMFVAMAEVYIREHRRCVKRGAEAELLRRDGHENRNRKAREP